jgi:hypothetical protein
MHVNKLSDHVYYYTDTVTEEEYDYVMSILKKEEGWERIYTGGLEYDPSMSPDDEASHSIMNAYRKAFVTDDINLDDRFSYIINKVFYSAMNNYKQEKNIKGERKINPYTHIDKHLAGTSYKSHVDTVAPGEDGNAPEGYTVLLYINDDYDGGEISFSFDVDYKYSTDFENVDNYVFKQGPVPTYPPHDDKNKNKISFWVKPGKMSVLIFPPVIPPHPHTAHTVRGNVPKYIIKNYWEPNGKVEHWNDREYF